MIRKRRDDFCEAVARKDVITKFEHDAISLAKAGEKRSILLSFTTDPYQQLDIKEQLTRKAIEILHFNGLKVSILTKGGNRSERDFDLLAAKPELSEYGVTLVFTDEKLRSKIEPNAAPTSERINTLKKAHELGIYTFVSLEPVWFAEQSLELIDLTHDFVDLYKVGKLNYNIQQKNVDWEMFREEVIKKLKSYNKNYYIKKDLENY